MKARGPSSSPASTAHGEERDSAWHGAQANARLLRMNERLSASLRELGRNEARLRAILAQSPVGIMSLNPRGQVTLANPAIATMVDRPVDELLERHCDVLGPELAGHILEFVASDAEGGGVSKTLWARRGDGHRFPVEVSLAKVRPRGQESSVTLVMRDLTAERKAAEQLAKANRQLNRASHLAGMAEVATGVLHNIGNVLNSANISVEQCKRLLGSFKTERLLGVASLLEELPSVRGGDMRDRREKIPRFLRALAANIDASAGEILAEVTEFGANLEHIKSIVSTQQQYARTTGVRELVTVDEIIENLVALVRATTQGQGIELVCEYDVGEPPLEMDRHKVLQILVNLLSNAAQAVEARGSRDIHLSVRRTTEVLEFAVRDDGVGIDDEQMEQLFTHGYTTRASGHGFGLHMSLNTAKAIGATLEAASPGAMQGATFTLRLPISGKAESPSDSQG